MSCEAINYTTNITDCCVLQVLCNGAVVKEFLLSELRIVDKGDSFEIRDRVSSLDFSNATVDLTAEELRTSRCNCTGAATACMLLNPAEPPDGNLYKQSGSFAFLNSGEFEDYMNNNLIYYMQFDCLVIILKDTGSGTVWVGQVINGVGTYVTDI